MADFCVLWFRLAHDRLKDGGRAGLVGTKTIRQNESREASLDYIVKNGGLITEAVSHQVWSGEAAVHVALVNWVKGEQPGLKKLYTQNGDAKDSPWTCEELKTIGPTLSSNTDASEAKPLAANQRPKLAYVGQYPFNDGFWLEPQEAEALLREDSKLRDVLFPYMIGRDLVEDGRPSRWIIDFGQREMTEAMRYAPAFERVKKLVMPVVLEKAQKEKTATGKESTRWTRLANRWWQLRDYQPGTMAAISRVSRYTACSRVTKRPIFEFISPDIHPDNTLVVFPLADDYSFGILQSSAHWAWFTAKCSTLTARFRYTSDTVFDTFPWPQFADVAQASPPASSGGVPAPSSSTRETASTSTERRRSVNLQAGTPALQKIRAVAEAAVALRALRREIMKANGWSLRDLYRTLETPGANRLRDAQADLDSAVRAAYGMGKEEDPLAFLLALNLELAEKEAKGELVTPPGLPALVPNHASFITDDCILPPE
jgi:hypothetical protein